MASPITIKQPPATDLIRYPKSTPPSVTTSGTGADSKPRAQEDVKKRILLECQNAVYECSPVLLGEAMNRESPKLPKTWDQQLPLALSEAINYHPVIKWLNGITRLSPQSNATFHVRNKGTGGEGRHSLKPDGGLLSSFLTSSMLVTWNGHRGAIEIKNAWTEAIQQALTYARKMLNDGNRWFAPVVIINQRKKEARFAVATHMGVFITKILDLQEKDGRRALGQLALTLSTFESQYDAGYDTSVIHAGGKLYFCLPVPGGPSWWCVVERLCKREVLRGSATHVYLLEEVVETDVEETRGMKKECVKEVVKTDNLESGIAGLGISDTDTTLRRAARLDEIGSAKQDADSHYGVPRGIKQFKRAPSSAPARAAPFATIGPPATASKPVDTASHPELPRIRDKDIAHLEPDASIDWGRIPDGSPRRLIMKDTFPLVERATTETEFLEAMSNQHGFAPIVGGITVAHPFKKFLDMPGMVACADLRQAYSGSDEEKLCGELRVERRLLMPVKGELLTTSGAALDIVHACVDALIGIYNAYSINWVHRDVSVGNVLLRPSPEVRSEEQIKGNACLPRLYAAEEPYVSLFKRHLTHCKCVIIDGDAAVHIDVSRKPSDFKSGTLEFMSFRLLWAWANNAPAFHCVLDDMEAIVWLLVYVLLSRKSDRNAMEQTVLAQLCSQAATKVAVAKGMLLGPKYSSGAFTWTVGNDSLKEIVVDWLRITDELGEEATKIFSHTSPESGDIDKKLDGIAHEYFMRYLRAGVAFLDRRNAYATTP